MSMKIHVNEYILMLMNTHMLMNDSKNVKWYGGIR